MSEWDKSVGVIVAEIKMMDAESKCLYWLLEGPSDIKFFSSRKKPGVELIVSGGKKNVIGSIQAFAGEPICERMLGIVDADIDWLLKEHPRPDNVITTDPRDLEGVLLRSSAYFKVLAEFANPLRVKVFEERHGFTVLDYVRDTAVFFGRIRAVNDLHEGISLKKFKPQIFIMDGSWEYDFEAALEFAVLKGVCASREELVEKMKALPDVFVWNYVRGHDAVDILTGGLVRELGNGGKVDGARIESVLRTGIDEAEFGATKLYRSINEWHAIKQI